MQTLTLLPHRLGLAGRWLAGVLALGVLLFVTAAAASAPSPEADVEQRLNRVLDALYTAQDGESLADREERVRAVMEATFSYEAMVRRAFGRHWNGLTPAEQSRLRELLVRLLVRSYLQRFGTGARPELSYRPAIALAPGRWEVPGTARIDGQTFSLAYRLLDRDGTRELYDVVIEGVSLVGNYREQIDAHFQRGQAAGLIARLEQQLREMEAASPPTTRP